MRFHVSAIVAFACFWQGAAVANNTIKLGYLYLQSGPTADKQSDSWVQETFAQFKLAVQHVNADPAVLPGHTLTYDVFDTEGKMLKALNGASDMLRDGSIVGVIGTGYSSAAEYAAAYCSFRKVPMISPGSTYIPLVDKSNYPYFLRSIANDVDLTRAQLAFVREMGWTDISVVLDFEDNQAMLKRIIEPTAALLGISLHIVSLPRTDSPDYTSDMMDAVVQAIIAAERNVVLARFRSIDGAEIWRAVQKYNCHGAGRVWLTDHNHFDTPAMSNWTNCIVAHRPEATHNPVKDKYINDWASSTVLWDASTHGFFDPVTKAPFYNDPWDTTVFDTDYSNRGDGQPDSWGMYAYDTVWLFADALGKMIAQGEDLSRGDILRTHLLASDRLGITGQILFDQGTQDRIDGVVLSHTSVVNGTGVKTVIRKATKALGLEVGEDWCREGCLTRIAEPLWSPDPMLANVVPLARPLDCAVGFAYDRVSMRCVECAFGFYAPVAGMRACAPCMRGSYQDETGAHGCKSCSPGTFAAEDGSTSCDACPAGQYQREQGQLACLPCEPGFVSGNASVECTLCSAGTFSDQLGAVQCEQCPQNMATTVGGTKCVCEESFLGTAQRCERCGRGVRCPVGAEVVHLVQAVEGVAPSGPHPALLPGFYAEPATPLTIYQCRPVVGLQDPCVGGQEGAWWPPRCREGHTGVMCAACEEGFGLYGGQCSACGQGDIVFFWIAAAFLLAIATALLVHANGDLMQKSHSVLIAGFTMGSLLTGFQTLTVFASFTVEWVEPMLSLFNMLQLFAFDLDLLKIGCVVQMGPIGKYAARLMVVPLMVLFMSHVDIVLILRSKGTEKLRRLVSYGGKDGKKLSIAQLHLMRTMNSAGFLMLIFNMPLAVSAFIPFRCYPQPTGESSLNAFPTILCSSSEHTRLVIAGVLGTLAFPVAFMCTCIYGVAKYPLAVRLRDHAFIQTFRWLFVRFRPPVYFYGLIHVSRNLLVALVPVVIIANTAGALQITVMMLILLLSVLIQVNCKPWPVPAANVVDTLVACLMIFFLLCGAFLVEAEMNAYVSAVVGWVSLIAVVLLALGGWAYALVVKRSPRLQYTTFVCHHKGDAAAQARLLHMVFTQHVKGRHFIDSDHLVDLDVLFLAVKSHVWNLCVYLTRATLERPWCLGEIVTARRNRVPVVPICAPCFTPPDEEWFAELELRLDLSTLVPYDISATDVKEAIRWMLELPRVRCSLFEGHGAFDSSVNQIMDRLDRAPRVRGAPVHLPYAPSISNTNILCIVDEGDAEAVAAGNIFSMLAGPYLVGSTLVLRATGTSSQASDLAQEQATRAADLVVVMLSRQLLRNAEAVALITLAIQEDTRVFGVNVDEGFSYPDDVLYNSLHGPDFELQRRVWATYGLDTQRVEVALRQLFLTIALPLHCAATMSVLGIQVSGILKRINRLRIGLNRASTVQRKGGFSPLPSSDRVKALEQFEEGLAL